MLSSAIVPNSESNRSKTGLPTRSVEETDISTPLLPVAQLELKAQLLLTRSTPHKRLVRPIGGRASREDGGADHLTLHRWLVPAVFVEESVVIRIASRGIGDEPDVSLCARSAGDGAGVVLGWKFGDINLQHAASCSGRDIGERYHGLDGV